MHYVYVLKSAKSKYPYIGYTNDLKRRLIEHNNGENDSTKNRIPWELIYYEAFKDQHDAATRERKLKHDGRGKALLKKRIERSLS